MDKLLKPCAHCGHDAEHLIMDGWDRIGCKLCGTLGGRYGSKEKAIKAWNTRTGETAPTMSEEEIENIIMLESNLDVEKINHLAKALSGKLPKQPTYSEEEIYNISCRCDTRNDFVKALSGKLQQPRKVDGKKIKQLIDDCVSVGNRTELFFSIMKEIGDE